MDDRGPVIRFHGSALAGLRKGRRLSLSHLAELVSRATGERVTYNAIYRWEAGLSEPRFSHAVALARVFRVQLDRLVQQVNP